MRQDTTKSDGGTNEGIELLITANGKLQMTWCDALDLEVLGGVTRKLEHFGGKVFENGRQIDTGFGSDARLLARDGAEVTFYATAGKL